MHHQTQSQHGNVTQEKYYREAAEVGRESGWENKEETFPIYYRLRLEISNVETEAAPWLSSNFIISSGCLEHLLSYVYTKCVCICGGCPNLSADSQTVKEKCWKSLLWWNATNSHTTLYKVSIKLKNSMVFRWCIQFKKTLLYLSNSFMLTSLQLHRDLSQAESGAWH